MLHSCVTCRTTVLFGGTQRDGRRYCSEKCADFEEHARRAYALPDGAVERALCEVLDGGCPVCGGPGPVEAFESYRVHSLIAATFWRTLPRISCRGCATRAQLGSVLYSLILGWWGFPWGFLMTPVQVFRNLAGLRQEAEPSRHSPLLEALVRQRLAAETLGEDAARAA